MKIKTGNLVLDITRTKRADNLIKEVVDPFMTQIKQKNIKVEYRVDAIEHEIIADWRLYKLAVFNII